MRKKVCLLMTLFFAAVLLAACSYRTERENRPSGKEGGEQPVQRIAVLVYDYSDDEVVSFRKYLKEYIEEIFPVEFIYSESILSSEDALKFIREASEYGAGGVMSFVSYDLKAETDLCMQKKMYYILASGTVSNEVFASVEDNPFFLGVIGPGAFIEYKAGSDLAGHFLQKQEGDEYFIFSGGGCMGNEMHKLRTEGILDTLQHAYGLNFEQTSEEIAESDHPLYLRTDSLSVCVVPGYFTDETAISSANSEYMQHPYGIVLSVLPVSSVLDTIQNARLGVVDCYSETNRQLFTDGKLDYLVGKYSSIIGPSFAAMYNALTGFAGDFRVNGKAFHITQGFWFSDSREDFEEKYTLASSIEKNAYNYEDLQQVLRVYNSEAGFEDLKELTQAYTYRDAVERRGQ